MHIPDGFLEPEVLIPLGLVSAAGIAVSLRKLSGNSPSAGRAPLVGLAAAFVFAAQMVNFPVASAVSGHLLGATFLAILFGPWMTLLVMSAVLILQAFLFQDGGITALGLISSILPSSQTSVPRSSTVLSRERVVAMAALRDSG